MTILGYVGKEEANKYILFFFIFGFGISLGPIVWLYLPEILPEKGVSIAALIVWLFTAIIGYVFPLAKDKFKIQGTFLFFTVCSIASLIFIIVVVKETKGKSSEELENLYNSNEKMEKKDPLLVQNSTNT